MKKTRKYVLENSARRAGGDRYMEQVPQEGDREPMMETAYVNQSMSRSAGLPANNLWITISTEPLP